MLKSWEMKSETLVCRPKSLLCVQWVVQARDVFRKQEELGIMRVDYIFFCKEKQGLKVIRKLWKRKPNFKKDPLDQV